MAARTADRLDERIRYRLVFADAYGRHGHPAKAIQLWQQILEDDSLREHFHLGHGPCIRAGTLAEESIAAAIHEHGRRVYAAYDAKARAVPGPCCKRSYSVIRMHRLHRRPPLNWPRCSGDRVGRSRRLASCSVRSGARKRTAARA